MSEKESIPYGFCQCGCGQKTSLAKATSARWGHVKGEPVRYRVGHANRRPIEDRFWENVKTGPDCWEWAGGLWPNGYGQFRGGGGGLAHRYAYELLVGSIPEGHQIHHLCETKTCVNPEHLKAVTPGEHGREHLSAACHRGHFYDEANTYHSQGIRFCRACRADYQRQLRVARKLKTSSPT